MKTKKMILFTLSLLSLGAYAAEREILNVSYDPTRELYQKFNEGFLAYWQSNTGEDIVIRQSHGGAGKQARAVIDGLQADVVTLALAYDINAISRLTGLIPSDWQQRLPNNSAPYTSTIVFLVRKDNPKNIKDWNDLVRADVQVITPNPKTSGGARWNYLAAWGYALKQNDNSEVRAREFVQKLFKQVPVLDSGARGATNTFVQRGIGDVLIAWENEAFLAVNELGPKRFDMVVPSVSIRAEPPVTVVDGNVDKHGTRDIAEAYLEYLYSAGGQTLAAKNYYRPSVPELVNPDELKRFPKVDMFSVEDIAGDWDQAQKKHFNEGGVFDQVYLR